MLFYCAIASTYVCIFYVVLIIYNLITYTSFYCFVCFVCFLLFFPLLCVFFYVSFCVCVYFVSVCVCFHLYVRFCLSVFLSACVLVCDTLDVLKYLFICFFPWLNICYISVYVCGVEHYYEISSHCSKPISRSILRVTKFHT